MKILLINLIILLTSVLIKSNNEYEQSTKRNKMENSETAGINGIEGQCYGYCFNIIQPVLAHTVSMQIMEQQIQEHSIILRTLENQLANLLAKVGTYEASEKCRNESEENKDMIESRHEIQSQIRDKLKELIVKIESNLASSCIGKLTDVYEIKVPGMEAFSVPCDSSLAGSGWTVIQRRKDGSVNFNRNWTDYREGFGDLRGEFFIGLEKLHLLTQSQPHELYISLMNFENETRFARYGDFVVGSEEEAYELKTLGLYSGNAGDSMKDHKNMKFSTPDRDRDTHSGDCAKIFSSGWWFSDCLMSNLNGLYEKEDSNKTYEYIIEWRFWKSDQPLKFTQMMIKPKYN